MTTLSFSILKLNFLIVSELTNFPSDAVIQLLPQKHSLLFSNFIFSYIFNWFLHKLSLHKLWPFCIIFCFPIHLLLNSLFVKSLLFWFNYNIKLLKYKIYTYIILSLYIIHLLLQHYHYYLQLYLLQNHNQNYYLLCHPN